MQYYPDYWRGWSDSERQSFGVTAKGFIETVVIKKNNDQSARLLELRSGNADSVYVQPTFVDEAGKRQKSEAQDDRQGTSPVHGPMGRCL